MDNVKLQFTLAKLYTLKSQRELFSLNPTEFKKSNDLNSVEFDFISRIDFQKLEEYANSLIQKRIGIAKKLIPNTSSILSNNWVSKFKSYAINKPLGSKYVYELDALNFIKWLISNNDLKKLSVIEIKNISLEKLQLKYQTQNYFFAVIKLNKNYEPSSSKESHSIRKNRIIFLRILGIKKIFSF